MNTDRLEVLVVDDDDCIREVLTTTLEVIGGFDVVPAASANLALDWIRRRRFDLVVLDAMMPDTSGKQMLERLRIEMPGFSTPVVLVTARTDPDDFDDFQRLGVVSVVTKPFPTLEFPNMLRQVVDDSRLVP